MGDCKIKVEWEVFPVGQNTYGIDPDGNGRIEPRDTFTVKKGEDPRKVAEAFLKERPWLCPPGTQCTPKVITKTQEQFYSHPVKRTLDAQLDRDIRRLEENKDRPKIYTKLLQDLRLMKEELPHVKFRSDKGELKRKGYRTDYDPITNTILFPRRAPSAFLMHEMDHALTARHRVEPRNVAPHEASCAGKPLYFFSEDPNRPPPPRAKTQFTVKLDFPIGRQREILYDDVKFWHPSLEEGRLGQKVCKTPGSRESVIAHEVQALQTEARYHLFQLGITAEELEFMQKAKTNQEVADFLYPRVDRYLQGTTGRNPDEVIDLILCYLGRGGETQKEDLIDLVRFYLEASKDPKMVDPPGCVKISDPK